MDEDMFANEKKWFWTFFGIISLVFAFIRYTLYFALVNDFHDYWTITGFLSVVISVIFIISGIPDLSFKIRAGLGSANVAISAIFLYINQNYIELEGTVGHSHPTYAGGLLVVSIICLVHIIQRHNASSRPPPNPPIYPPMGY